MSSIKQDFKSRPSEPTNWDPDLTFSNSINNEDFDVQKIHAFISWMNFKLSSIPQKTSKNWAGLPPGYRISEEKFEKDLQDGRRLLLLAEALTRVEQNCENNPALIHSKLVNVERFISIMEAYGRRPFINIRAADICSGKNRKILLALMWNTILASAANETEPKTSKVKRTPSSAKDLMNALLEKINQDLSIYPNNFANNYTNSWSDGKALAGLLHRYGYWPEHTWVEIEHMPIRQRVEHAQHRIDTKLNIPSMVTTETFINQPEMQSNFVYIKTVYNSLATKEPLEDPDMNNKRAEIDTQLNKHADYINKCEKLCLKAKLALEKIMKSPHSNKDHVYDWYDRDLKECNDVLANLQRTQDTIISFIPKFVSESQADIYEGKIENLENEVGELKTLAERFLRKLQAELEELELKQSRHKQVKDYLKKAEKLAVSDDDIDLKQAREILSRAKNLLYDGSEFDNIDRDLDDSIQLLDSQVKHKLDDLFFTDNVVTKLQSLQDKFRRGNFDFEQFDTEVLDLITLVNTNGRRLNTNTKKLVHAFGEEYQTWKDDQQKKKQEQESQKVQIVWELLKYMKDTADDQIPVRDAEFLEDGLRFKTSKVINKPEPSHLNLEKDKLLKGLLNGLRIIEQSRKNDKNTSDLEKRLTHAQDQEQNAYEALELANSKLKSIDIATQNLKQELKQEQSEKRQYQERSLQLQREINNLDGEIARSKLKYKSTSDLIDVINDLQNDCKNRSENIAKLNNKRAKQIKDINKLIQNLENNHLNSSPNVQDLEDTLYTTLKKLGTITDHSSLDMAESSLLEERNRLLDSERNLKHALRKMEKREFRLKSDLEQALSEKHQSVSLTASLTNKQAEIDRLENEVKKCRDEAVEHDDQLRFLSERKSVVEKSLEDLHNQHQQLKLTHESRVEQYLNLLKTLKQESQRLNAKLNEEIQARKELEQAYERLNEELKEAKDTVFRLEASNRSEKKNFEGSMTSHLNEQRKIEKIVADLKSELSDQDKKYSEQQLTFDVERDELNWTIKLLRKQAEDNQKEASHFAQLKKQSDQLLVKAVDRQREYNKELNAQIEINKSLENELADMKFMLSKLELLKDERHLEREQYETMQRELQNQKEATARLLEHQKNDNDASELERLRREIRKVQQLNAEVKNDIDDAGKRARKYEKLFKEEKTVNEQLKLNLERSQEQERKIYLTDF